MRALVDLSASTMRNVRSSAQPKRILYGVFAPCYSITVCVLSPKN